MIPEIKAIDGLFSLGLLVLVAWYLWRKISELEKKRDIDIKDANDKYEAVLERMFENDKQLSKSIDNNSVILQRLTDLIDKKINTT